MAFGTQAMPTFEHETSLSDARWQERQPSDHSRHVAVGGVIGLVAAGAAGCCGFSGRSAASDTLATASATATSEFRIQ
jgi:hypothetical protein